MVGLSNVQHSTANVNFKKCIYHKVYAFKSASPTINGTVVNMVAGSTIDILVKSISYTPDVYLIGHKKIIPPLNFEDGRMSNLINFLTSNNDEVENIDNLRDYLTELEEFGLLNKSSIVITPNSVSENFIHTTIPTRPDDFEVLVNGDFSSASNWDVAAGWEISNGVASRTSTSASNLTQNVFQAGKTYVVSWTQSGVGAVAVYIDGTKELISNKGVGTYSKTVTSTAGGNLTFRANITTPIIDNVSVKQVLGADLNVIRETPATRVNEQGFIETVENNIARIDHTDPLNPCILVEPQRTNLISRSEVFNLAPWQLASVSLLENTDIIAPDGTSNVFSVVGNTSNAVHSLYINSGVTDQTTYSFSVFFKRKTMDFVRVSMGSGFSGEYVNINLVDGSAIINTFPSSKIEDYGNGWYRFSGQATRQATGTPFISIILIQDENVTSNTPYVSNSTEEVYVWGVQLEEGSYATSLIPTNGTSVTRNVDIVSKTGISNYINSIEGIFYLEISALANTGTFRDFSISDGTSSNRFSLTLNNDANSIRLSVVVGGVNKPGNVINVDNLLNYNKVALKYKSNDCALFVNGVKYSVINSEYFTTNNILNKISSDNGSGGSKFYGKIKNIQVYPTVLTDAELITLTTQ